MINRRPGRELTLEEAREIAVRWERAQERTDAAAEDQASQASLAAHYLHLSCGSAPRLDPQSAPKRDPLLKPSVAPLRSATPALSSGRRTQWRGQDWTPIRGQSSAPIAHSHSSCWPSLRSASTPASGSAGVAGGSAMSAMCRNACASHCRCAGFSFSMSLRATPDRISSILWIGSNAASLTQHCASQRPDGPVSTPQSSLAARESQ